MGNVTRLLHSLVDLNGTGLPDPVLCHSQGNVLFNVKINTQMYIRIFLKGADSVCQSSISSHQWNFSEHTVSPLFVTLSHANVHLPIPLNPRQHLDGVHSRQRLSCPVRTEADFQRNRPLHRPSFLL